MDGLDGIDVEKFLNCPEKCVARIILTQLMEYKVSVDCPIEAWVRSWIKKNAEHELDRNSGLL